MTAALTLIWNLAGQPDVNGSKGKLLKPEPGICSITGEYSEITADASKALGDNFTDQSLWACHSGRVGKASLWCCSGAGRTSPRLWSWVAAPGENLPPSHEKAYAGGPGLCLTNRANTRPIIDILLNPPAGEWVVSIAESGQKHVLPYVQTNRGAGEWKVRMEATNITATPEQFRTVFTTCLALRRLGVPVEAIKTGEPQYLKTTEDLATWRELSQRLRPYQSSPITNLALWCITKPIMEDTHAYPNP